MNNKEKIEAIRKKVESWLMTYDSSKLNVQSEDYKKHWEMLKELSKDVFPELYGIVFLNSDADLIFINSHIKGFMVYYYNPDSNEGGQFVKGLVSNEDMNRLRQGDSLMEVIESHAQWLNDVNDKSFFETFFYLLRTKEKGHFLGTGTECIINHSDSCMQHSILNGCNGMRVDKSVGDFIYTEDTFYIIEEYQSRWNRWVSLTHHYLKEYEFGEFSACGQCWQETGIHGCYDLEYTKTYCNKLNEALKNGLLDEVKNGLFENKIETAKITKFRISECEKVFKKRPLIADKY